MDRFATKQKALNSINWHKPGFLGAFLSVLAIFFIVPIFDKNFFTHFLLECSFILLILSTIRTVEKSGTAILAGVCLLIPFVVFDSLCFLTHSKACMVIAYIFSVTFNLFSIIVLMRKIFKASLVNLELIFGALMVYLLAGILWGNLYFLENTISPGSFQGSDPTGYNPGSFLYVYEQQFNFLYYSFATLATLGMGDITPQAHLAKSLTAIEAMFGQLFVAIIMAKLVSVWWQVPGQKNM